jgi:hypothetical protein
MSGRSSHQRWLAVLAAGGVATGGVVALTSAASATTSSTSTRSSTAASPTTGGQAVTVDTGTGAIQPLLGETKTLSNEIAAARKRLAALGGSNPTVYVTTSPGLAAQAAQLAAERAALTAEAAALVRQERALQAEARSLAAEAAALAKTAAKPPTQGGTGASGSGGGDG